MTMLTVHCSIVACFMQGVGPATASAMLAVADPSLPFMSDEAMVAALPKPHRYTAKEYLQLLEALRNKAAKLSKSSGGLCSSCCFCLLHPQGLQHYYCETSCTHGPQLSLLSVIRNAANQNSLRIAGAAIILAASYKLHSRISSELLVLQILPGQLLKLRGHFGQKHCQSSCLQRQPKAPKEKDRWRCLQVISYSQKSKGALYP